MTQKTKLTKEQKDQIEIYWKRYFDMANCTEPADRPRAEKAVRELCSGGCLWLGAQDGQW